MSAPRIGQCDTPEAVREVLQAAADAFPGGPYYRFQLFSEGWDIWCDWTDEAANDFVSLLYRMVPRDAVTQFDTATGMSEGEAILPRDEFASARERLAAPRVALAHLLDLARKAGLGDAELQLLSKGPR